MEKKSKMERLVSDTERSITEKKEVVLQKIEQENDASGASEKSGGAGLPPTEALKRFFDRVPLSSVPGIGNAGGKLALQALTARLTVLCLLKVKHQLCFKSRRDVIEEDVNDTALVSYYLLRGCKSTCTMGRRGVC